MSTDNTMYNVPFDPTITLEEYLQRYETYDGSEGSVESLTAVVNSKTKVSNTVYHLILVSQDTSNTQDNQDSHTNLIITCLVEKSNFQRSTFKQITKKVVKGDILGITGKITVTNGNLSIAATHIKIMGKIQVRSEEEIFRDSRLSKLTRADYSHKYEVHMSISDYVQMYGTTNEDDENFIAPNSRHQDKVYSLAGRVVEKRSSGNHILFFTMKSGGAQVQYLFFDDAYQGTDFRDIFSTINRGDIVGVFGMVGKSAKGELSIIPFSYKILTPCCRTLPKQGYGFTDPELRYRQRYLDMIVHDEAIKTAIDRALIEDALRTFLKAHQFLEVSTPILNTSAGGATAKPFETFHNELQMPMFLRIAPELFLKRLIVGGMERVFEIGKQFRNEGIDPTHNPEFTSAEFYAAYLDYNDLMTLTEKMLVFIVKRINNDSLVVQYGDKTIDFTPPFRRVNMIEELEMVLDVEFPQDLGTEETHQFLIDQCTSKEVECPPPLTTARLIDRLVGEFIEPTCDNPTFICNHPQIMSPLAKWHRDNDQLTERFELFVVGMEIANAYTEQNNPVVQREQFEAQVQAKSQGDEEAQGIDEDFVCSLEYGLPPTAGWGMGIDRLTMLLTNNTTIREVILFPTLKDNQQPSS